MTKLIAIFRSRSQAVDCFKRMNNCFIPAKLINAPDEANVGCGLSVEIPCGFARRAKKMIAAADYSTFCGYLKLKTSGKNMNFKHLLK